MLKCIFNGEALILKKKINCHVKCRTLYPFIVCVFGSVYLVLLSSSLFIVVENVFSDVLPALMLSRDVVNSSLPELISAAFLVPHCHCHQHR